MKIIANPSSNAGRGRHLWNFWKKELARGEPDFCWQESASADDCRNRAALAGVGQETVVAVGGDGTINLIINGLMANESPPPLGVLYAGTSPDFCAFHDLPTEPRAALETLLAGQIRKVDLAEIILASGDGRMGREWFADSCNIGLGAATARFANSWRRYLGDSLGTSLGLLLSMLRRHPFQSAVTVDGEKFSFRDTNHILVLKNPHIASGLKLNLNIKADDGRLAVVAVHGYNRWNLWVLFASLYQGTFLRKRGVFAKLCSRAVVAAETKEEVEFDGDPHGFTPAAITVRPQALLLIAGGKHG